ncbi:hypothetical protein GGF44_005501 [Coemansia sp. RSA 1694]|nr:hypothetical protein IWW47_000334 [Coemansia sp. RSA 2052]KAJ2620816.1 hypothetical protein GGF44_005501 [Coemansia sp. RSA 1694]
MVTRKKRAYNSVARIITSVVGTSYKLVQIHTGKYDFPGVQQEWYMIQDDEIMVLFFKGLRWMQDIDEDYVRDICVRVKEEAELYIYTRRWRPEDNDAKRLVTDDLSLDSMHNSRVSRGVAKSTQNVNAN